MLAKLGLTRTVEAEQDSFVRDAESMVGKTIKSVVVNVSSSRAVKLVFTDETSMLFSLEFSE